MTRWTVSQEAIPYRVHIAPDQIQILARVLDLLQYLQRGVPPACRGRRIVPDPDQALED